MGKHGYLTKSRKKRKNRVFFVFLTKFMKMLHKMLI